MFGRKRPIKLNNPLLVAFFEDDGSLNVRIDADQLEAPGWAGIILADLETHFANALAHTGKATSPEAALTDIRAAYQAEISHPTDTPTGHIEN
ncbi:DUF5076 domain-containing protein [Aliiroseovarius sp. S1339]|uniref:DUF5076 domain-containing protein n=1 Tax=Aliiroseovarius sp. S1339 TaxID=2936990 RepID=UPI0020BF5E05|nr:DUF5076 domain-containing protein [Aliiroseovarius sp. S1339]MCK8462560.1 DUF5076 domain-containing protein [Aliiroseovarius sp. S1339]